MKTSALRAMSHMYMLNRMDRLPADHKDTLHTQYAELMTQLHREVRYKHKLPQLLAIYHNYLALNMSRRQAVELSLEDFIHLHANDAYCRHYRVHIPQELDGWHAMIGIDSLYRRAADALMQGIQAALNHVHSSNPR